MIDILLVAYFASLRCSRCGGWVKWKGDHWHCGVCGHNFRP